MLTRRQFLTRTLQGSSLLAFGSLVPGFVARTAQAAEVGKDNILVIIEMTGGNDGLNTVIPYADDLYHKARPTLHFTKEQVVRVNDQIGLHPAMRSFDQLLQQGQLAVVLGIGYPNPDRSHFESMDIWQSGDPKRKTAAGWIGRSAPALQGAEGNVPVMHIGAGKLPLAVAGSAGGAISINEKQPYRLDLGGGSAEQHKARRQLLEDLAQPADADPGNLLDFVARRQVQTLLTLDRLQDVLRGQGGQPGQVVFGPDGRPIFSSLPQKLFLISQLIQRGFGTRVFYVSIDGFDTHANQAQSHPNLLQQLADGVTNFFQQLKPNGHDKRVRVMTFSEFGRRVQENGSRGTDHGAASCLFVAGGGLKGGPVGEYPSLKDLDDGDLKFKIDFRRLYATLLDGWLGVESRTVLGGKFDHLPQLSART
jgi:uncharacterized protein (DUF1501 family)